MKARPEQRPTPPTFFQSRCSAGSVDELSEALTGENLEFGLRRRLFSYGNPEDKVDVIVRTRGREDDSPQSEGSLWIDQEVGILVLVASPEEFRDLAVLVHRLPIVIR